MTDQTLKDIDRAFKALEERDELLDKIRAEIEQITDTMGVSYNQYVSKIDVLQIIDKYKAESNLPLCEDVIHGDFMGVMDKE